MSWKAWIAGVALASGGSYASAKPADLPVDQRHNTAGEQGELPSPKYLQHPPQYIPPSPAYPLPRELKRLPNFPELTPVAVDQMASPTEAKAVEVFRRAEAHRQRGDISQARRGYEEVHLMAPTSAVGQQAIERLRELESPANDFHEEQEPPLNRMSLRPAHEIARPMHQPKPTREQYDEMLRQTQPLGGFRAPRDDY